MIYSFELILPLISYNKLFDMVLSCMICLICTCPAWFALVLFDLHEPIDLSCLNRFYHSSIQNLVLRNIIYFTNTCLSYCLLIKGGIIFFLQKYSFQYLQAVYFVLMSVTILRKHSVQVYVVNSRLNLFDKPSEPNIWRVFYCLWL